VFFFPFYRLAYFEYSKRHAVTFFALSFVSAIAHWAFLYNHFQPQEDIPVLTADLIPFFPTGPLLVFHTIL